MNERDPANQNQSTVKRRVHNIPASGISSSLVDVDNPDDVFWEGEQMPPQTRSQKPSGDNAYVTVDNPDDFE